MKIVVLAGGISPERDVSLCSASLIANALLNKGHEVAFVDVYVGVPEGTLLENLFFTKESGKQFSYAIPESEPDLEALIAANGGRRDLIGPGVLEISKLADVASDDAAEA